MTNSCSSFVDPLRTLPSNNLNLSVNRPITETNKILLKLKNEILLFSKISSYLTIKDSATMSCSSRALNYHSDTLLWRPLGIQIGLTNELTIESHKQAIQDMMKNEVLASLIKNSPKKIEEWLGPKGLASIPDDQFESFLRMAAKLPQTRFNEIFSSKIEGQYLFNSLANPDHYLRLMLIFDYFSTEKLNFLFNQKAEDGWTFIHKVCEHDNKEFTTFILSHIPEENVENCLNALAKEELTPLLYTVAKKYHQSLLAIIKYASKKGKLELLLKQKLKQHKLNFIQHICGTGKTELVVSIFNLLDFGEREQLLTSHNYKNTPLFLAASNNHFETFHAIVNLVPCVLTLTCERGNTLLHDACESGIPEIFSHIDRYLTVEGSSLKLNWKELLSIRDTRNGNPPLFYLAQIKGKNINKLNNAILILKEIGNRLDKKECLELIQESELLHASLLETEAFDLASYIISKYPELITKKTPNNKDTIWHKLASVTSSDPLKEQARINFFNKCHSLCMRMDIKLHIELNQISKFGFTPLSMAYESGLYKLAKTFRDAGALKSIHDMTYSTKILAQHWSIKGEATFEKAKYQLESWHISSALKEVFYSLKKYSSKHPDLKDLKEAYSIFELHKHKQLSALKMRVAKNKIWIKPLTLKMGKSSHVVTIIGSSKLVLLFNRAPTIITIVNEMGEIEKTTPIPASLVACIPPKGFNLNKILSWEASSIAFPFQIIHHFMNIFKFKVVYAYPLESQRTGNCPAASSEGGVFGYMGLSKILNMDEKITKALIIKTFDSVKPDYQRWLSFNHWKQLRLHRKLADKQLVAAIESLVLIRYAKKIIQNTSGKALSYIKYDPSFFPLHNYVWEDLSEDKQDFFTDVSHTPQRHEFIKKLFSLSQQWLTKRLIKFIENEDLVTLKPLIKQIVKKNSIATRIASMCFAS